MSLDAAERLLQALLFEGHVLYPYRASSLKNRRRWTFGTLYPRWFCEHAAAGDASSTRTECLVTGEEPLVTVSVRFLRSFARRGTREPEREPWNESVERSIDSGELAMSSLAGGARRIALSFDACTVVEEAFERRGEALEGVLEVSATRLDERLWQLRVTVENATGPGSARVDRTEAELRALVAAHVLLSCREGRFVSQQDPPPEFVAHAAGCRCDGAYPVLIGGVGTADVMLSSPIILNDDPKVAPKSPGDLFDATEIDEILSLRIRTLGESERQEAMATDPRAKEILERTESLGEEDLFALHGVCSFPAGEHGAPRAFAPGDAVVLRPQPGGDVFDLALAGEAATVLGIEEDFEGRIYYTVTVDADPGRDLGALGEPGHRFFFTAEELERAS